MSYTLLIDADIAIYHATTKAEVETDWGDDLWSLHSDLADAKRYFYEWVTRLAEKVDDNPRLVMCLSDHRRNFRKEMYPDYKANRKGKRRPLAYRAFEEWVKGEYESVMKPTLEADDVMGILATSGAFKQPVIISQDKDLKQIPGEKLDFDKKGQATLVNVTPEQGAKWHLYQTLVGDAIDNYKGCPGIGDKRAQAALDKSPTWATVLNLFHKAKLTEEDALLQARLARILQASDWDSEKQEIIPWVPQAK